MKQTLHDLGIRLRQLEAIKHRIFYDPMIMRGLVSITANASSPNEFKQLVYGEIEDTKEIIRSFSEVKK